MKKRKGISLIEIIISIAIIGLVAISTLSIFNGGLININRAGARTDNVLIVKEKMDVEINNLQESIEETINPEESSDIQIEIGEPIDVTIRLPGVDERPINGVVIEAKNTDNHGNSIILNTFIPK